jgi:alpha/beta superfamily hydrolase
MRHSSARIDVQDNEPAIEPMRKSFVLLGPAGPLEAILSEPEGVAQVSRVVVVCHPHPLHGGTMHNKVVHYLAKTFSGLGAASLRFNYRGVGQSGGEYGEGVGETEDVLAAATWLRQRYPQAELWLAGFSFGAYTSLKAAASLPVAGLISIAPPVHLFDMATLPTPACPWLIVQGDHDMVVSYKEVSAWVNTLDDAPQFVPMAGVGHFFHGKLNALQEVLRDFLIRRGFAEPTEQGRLHAD